MRKRRPNKKKYNVDSLLRYKEIYIGVYATGVLFLVFLAIHNVKNFGVFLESTSNQIILANRIDPNILSARKLSRILVSNQKSFSAESVLIQDLTSNKVLYSKNSDTPHNLASLTKILTILYVDKEYPPQAQFTIEQEDLAPIGEFGFREGDTVSRDAIFGSLLVASANDGARIFERRSENFVKNLNEYTKNLGLVHTKLYNESGWDNHDYKEVSSGTATDIMKALDYINNHNATDLMGYNKKFYTIKTAQNRTIEFENTNPLVEEMPGVVFSKTGYTDLAGGNLSLIIKTPNSHKIGVVILKSTYEGRFHDGMTIAKLLAANYKTNS